MERSAVTDDTQSFKPNVFQRLMWAWRELAPYNAGQAMLLRGTPNLALWNRALDRVFHAFGLGSPQWDGQLVRMQAGAPPTVVQANAALEEQLAAQLNQPFLPGDPPIRGFLIPQNGQYYFGLFYDHWIADSSGIRLLLEQVYKCYREPDAAPAAIARICSEEPRSRLGEVAAAARSYVAHARAYRPHLHDPMDFAARCFCGAAPPGTILVLLQKARAIGCTVHDLFLAALAQSLGVHTAAERYRRRRKPLHLQRDRVAVGTIAAGRGPDSRRCFGLNLSCYTTVVSKPETQPLENLALAISRRTRRMKSRDQRAALGPLYHVEFWWKQHHSPRARAQFFHKNAPLLGGISNVNLTGEWMASAPDVLDYLRVSPTGPLLPLVFTISTTGEKLSLCVTYRRTAFEEAQARAICADFLGRLCAVRP